MHQNAEKTQKNPRTDGRGISGLENGVQLLGRRGAAEAADRLAGKDGIESIHNGFLLKVHGNSIALKKPMVNKSSKHRLSGGTYPLAIYELECAAFLGNCLENRVFLQLIIGIVKGVAELTCLIAEQHAMPTVFGE